MKHIICFHLLNDYSGSPKVLQIVLKGMLDKGYKVDLYTSNGGALDELLSHEKLKKVFLNYHFSTIRIVTILRFLGVQAKSFFFAFRYLFDHEAVFYINTLLPFAPAFAGRLMGKRVIYHCHEAVLNKGVYYRMLNVLMQLLASEIICVSREQRKDIKRKKNVTIIPNGIPKEISNLLSFSAESHFEQKNVLMLSSLKSYKGIAEFLQIANSLPDNRFTLVINDTNENIDSFFKKNRLLTPQNVIVYPKQTDVIPFYNCSSLLLNLSNKDEFVETFGLTVVEAIMAGIPSIVPTVGGISELVADGVNGYKIDIQEIDMIVEKIALLLSNQQLYDQMCINTFALRKKYGSNRMINKILVLVNK